MRRTTPHIKPSPGTPHRVYRGKDYTETDKIFPWSPSRSTRRQTTNMQTSLPLVPLSKHQGTDYTRNIEAFSCTPFSKVPGDKLYIDNKQVFSWSLLEHQETDYTRDNDRQLSLPLGFLSEYTRGQANKHKQAFLWHLSSVPKDRLRGDIKALPWHSFQRDYQGMSYIKTDKPSHGTQSWNHETDYIKLELNRTVNGSRTK